MRGGRKSDSQRSVGRRPTPRRMPSSYYPFLKVEKRAKTEQKVGEERSAGKSSFCFFSFPFLLSTPSSHPIEQTKKEEEEEEGEGKVGERGLARMRRKGRDSTIFM